MIGAVILAAGASRRMGRPKLILPWRDGETIIEHVVGVYQAAGAKPVVIVSAENDDRLASASLGLDVVRAQVPLGGEMLSSVKAGLSALEDPEIEAALLAPADHPLLAPDTVSLLIDTWRAGTTAIVAPSIDRRRGHPILIGRSLWSGIMSLEPDRTLRDFLRSREDEIRYVIVEDQGVIRDVDTPSDYDRARGEANSAPSAKEADG